MSIHVDINNNNINVDDDAEVYVAPVPPHPQPNDQDQADQAVDQAMMANPQGKRVLILALGAVIVTILTTLLASILPWFRVVGFAEFFAQNDYLWLFLLPPLSAIPLMFSSITLVGRVCWLHCWTVTVISVDVPSVVIFVSFGASLIYTGKGTVIWSTGAFMVLFSHIFSMVAGLLFMKLAQIIEAGPVPVTRPPPGPISITIGEGNQEISSDQPHQPTSPFLQAP